MRRRELAASAVAAGVATLLAELPIAWPCQVDVGCAGRGRQGWAEVADDLAAIRVSDRAGPASARATLAHEWAHLLAWADPAATGQPDHGPRWRELHAEARRALGLNR